MEAIIVKFDTDIRSLKIYSYITWCPINDNRWALQTNFWLCIKILKLQYVGSLIDRQTIWLKYCDSAPMRFKFAVYYEDDIKQF